MKNVKFAALNLDLCPSQIINNGASLVAPHISAKYSQYYLTISFAIYPFSDDPKQLRRITDYNHIHVG